MSDNNNRILYEPVTYQDVKKMSDKVAISGIYKIENLINHRVYIGKSVNVISRLKRGHFLLQHEVNPYLKNSIQKHGFENFSFEIIKQTYDLDYWEIFLIQLYHATDKKYGYNISIGGCGGNTFKGRHHTEEAKRKKREAMKKFYATKVWTAEERYALGHWRGKHHTEEYKRKQSEVHKGLNKYPKTEEHKQKISQALKGNIPWNKGMKMSSEICKQRSDSKKRLYNSNRGKQVKQKLHDYYVGQVWWNNGTSEIRSKEQPEGFVRGRIGSTKRYWYTNGTMDIFIHKCPIGFTYGRTFPNVKGTRWNNGKDYVFATSCPGKGFVKGELKKSRTHVFTKEHIAHLKASHIGIR